VNGLLRIARLDLDTGLLLQSINLAQLCRTEVERQKSLTEAGIRFIADGPPLGLVLIDPNQFREVLARLLGSARHFAANKKLLCGWMNCPAGAVRLLSLTTGRVCGQKTTNASLNSLCSSVQPKVWDLDFPSHVRLRVLTAEISCQPRKTSC